MGCCSAKKSQYAPGKGENKAGNANSSSSASTKWKAESSVVQDGNTMQVASKFRHEDIHNEYNINEAKVLGSGFAGPVLLCDHKVTKKQYAVKSYNKRCKSKKKFDILKAEVNVYLKLDHPHIAKLVEVYEDEEMLHLVMEHCTGGELYHRLIASRNFNEGNARDVTKQMLLAISYLHNTVKVVHRDLKLENWLYANKTEGSNVKLIDFGFAKVWETGTSNMVEDWGSLLYCAPDVIKRNYTNKCDMWSLGVIVFMLLSGEAPFWSTAGEREVLKRIQTGKYEMTSKVWKNISSKARDFVKRLLVVDETARMSAVEALEHEWMLAKNKSEQNVTLDVQVVGNLRDFAAASKLKRAVLCMMAYSLTSEEISGIEDIFFKLDPNKTGEISLQEFFEVLKTHLVISNDEVERLFAVMDSNQRGKLSYTEFVAAMLQTRVQMNEDVIRESFDRLDKEHKGTISKTDLRNALGGQSFDGMDVEQLFTECGVVGETIDYETFNKMMVSKFERDGKANVAGTKSVDTWNKSAKRKNSAGRNSLSLQDGQTRSFGANTFTANSPEMLEFEATLRKHGIDVSEFGKGEAKSIGDLFWEVQKSECVMGLHKGEFKRMLRVLRLALWVVTHSGEKRVLMEGDQQLQDGRIREGRNKRVAKKMSVGEFWKDALARALFSELSLEQEFQNQHLEFLEQIEVDNERYAKGYPGLKTVYQFCDVSMRVKDPAHADCTKLGLPNCEDFVTEEMSMLGTDRRHFWTWQTEGELKVLMDKESEERQKFLAENAARLGGDLQGQKKKR